MIKQIGKALVMKGATVAAVASFVASYAQKGVSKAAQQCFVIAPPVQPPSSGGSSSSDENWRTKKPRKPLR